MNLPTLNNSVCKKQDECGLQETIEFHCEKCNMIDATVTYSGAPQYIECSFCKAQYIYFRDSDSVLKYHFVKFTEKIVIESVVDGENNNYQNIHHEKSHFGFENDEDFVSAMPTKRREAFTLFGLSSEATKKQIKKRYRKLAFKYHPDKHSDLSEKKITVMESLLKKIIAAYKILS